MNELPFSQRGALREALEALSEPLEPAPDAAVQISAHELLHQWMRLCGGDHTFELRLKRKRGTRIVHAKLLLTIPAPEGDSDTRPLRNFGDESDKKARTW